MGTLYVVGAPLATPEDTTLRALRILRQVRLVVAGESEGARQFLAHLDLQPRLIVVAGPGEALGQVLAALETEDAALLQEGLADSTGRLIQGAAERGFPVVPVPGPVAPVSALVVSGLPANSFIFLGYMTEGLDRALPPNVAGRHTLVALETAGSLAGTVARLRTELGDRPVVLDGRFADWPQGAWHGMLGTASDHLAAHPAEGACVVVIGAGERRPARWDFDRLRAEIEARLDGGQSAAEIGRQVGAESGWSRREVYRQVLARRASQRADRRRR